MRTPIVNTRAAAWLVCLTFAVPAFAQSDHPWDGWYLGAHVGEAQSKACGTSTLEGTATAGLSGVSFAACASSSVVGGLQVGDDFQTKRLVVGFGADIDIAAAKKTSESVTSVGQAAPPGLYAQSGKLSPSDLVFVGPRVGYAGDLWLPYIRGGGIFSLGSHDSTLSFTPAGAKSPTASFNSGRNFGSTGWAAGGGTEIGLNGAWSISVDYLHVSLGKGPSSTAACSGPATASACAAFAGLSLDSSRSGFTANLFRVGINYWFGYWDP